VEQVLVAVGDRVRAGDPLATLQRDALERAVQSAEQALIIQKANLTGLTREPEPYEIAAARAAVESAQARLLDLLSGPSTAELEQAQAAVNSAQAQLDDLTSGPSTAELAQAQAALSNARAALKAAQQRMAVQDGQLLIAQNNIEMPSFCETGRQP